MVLEQRWLDTQAFGRIRWNSVKEKTVKLILLHITLVDDGEVLSTHLNVCKEADQLEGF